MRHVSVLACIFARACLLPINNNKVEQSAVFPKRKRQRIAEKTFVSNLILLSVEILTLITRALSSEMSEFCDSLFWVFIVKNIFEILKKSYFFGSTFCFYKDELEELQSKEAKDKVAFTDEKKGFHPANLANF